MNRRQKHKYLVIVQRLHKDAKRFMARYVSKHVYQGYFYGFKKGAEFGYNKANEWHKPSEKLPEECSLVLAYSFEDTEPSLYKFVTNDQWEWMPRRIAFLSNDQIRLWKEIGLPKEIKKND